ncbi:MAG: hypothetical protein KatS3mg105_0889 [Gemmatales bacterium]|nr:MAG: hypothetical protein KatS3mg105_0889 [Gemmatales bacterium]
MNPCNKNVALAVVAFLPLAARAADFPKDDGYRGLWYMNQPSNDEYRYKYSGGMATYPQQHVPIAVYSAKANKTFFCYGGTIKGKRELLHMVSYYDHATGKVPRPTILLNKKTDDAHDNPTMQIDDRGHIWIFSSAHGTARPSFIHRSKKPFNIDDFELVLKTNFSYTQPWFLPGQGFFFLHTRYAKGRNLFWMTSTDGFQWSQPSLLAKIEKGHYQVSWSDGKRVGTAFNFHPNPVGLNARTNLYYLESSDMGKTWRNAAGEIVDTPIRAKKNAALVHDFQSEKLLVYLKSVNFDHKGRPVILFLTSRHYAAGPQSGPRTWRTAQWTGNEWRIRTFTASDHNYDFGPLYVEKEGWRVIAPTEPGPQPFGTGGEMVMWFSPDEGATWKKVKQLTANSERNHSYARKPVHAHPDFYALWADGNARKPSESYLYFATKAGVVRRLPPLMREAFAEPEVVKP